MPKAPILSSAVTRWYWPEAIRGAVEAGSCGQHTMGAFGDGQRRTHTRKVFGADPHSDSDTDCRSSRVTIAAVLPSGAATMSASPASNADRNADRHAGAAADHGARPSVPALARHRRVYHSNSSSAVVGHLRRGRYVHITGLTGNWLRIRLPNGTVGFIPDEAVE